MQEREAATGTASASKSAFDPAAWLAQCQSDRDDPLLDCLVFLTHYHGRPKSSEVLLAGLPMSGPRISPKMFMKAAERAGLRSKIVKRALVEIPELVLPAVIVLASGEAGVLLARRENGECEVIWPSAGGGSQVVELASLEEVYGGFSILVRPDFDHVRLTDPKLHPEDKGQGIWFWQTILGQRWIYGQVALAAVVVNLFALALPMFTMAIYDRIIPNAATETLWVLTSGLVIVMLFDFAIKTLRGYFIETAGKKADVILACRLFDQVLDIRMAARPGSSGGFASTLKEFESLREFFASATLSALIDLPFVILFIGVIGLISGPVAFIFLFAIALILAYGFFVQFPIRSVVNRFFKEGQDKHGILVETINGLETIKCVGADGRMRQLWEVHVGRSAKSGEMSRALSLSAVNFAAMLQQLATISVYVFGVYLVLKGDLTTGGLVACGMLSGRALAPLGQIANLLTRLNQSIVSLKALNSLMSAPTERSADRQFLNRPLLSGAIAFEHVRFSYPGRDHEALRDVSFSVKPGEKVAFIGRIGSGKSTLAKLILNLYEPNEGAILVDGTDLRQVDPVDLRRNIGYVGQEPFLFRGSIRDNISAAMPHADDTWVLHTAQLAGVDDFVRQISTGYDTPVGERGEGLSGGQRQQVTIARALLRDPPILVFDEPTSSMDSRSEEALVARLKTSLKDKTLLLITHRGSLLNLVDRVIILDGGKIVADGPRANVLEALAAGRISTART